MIKKLVLRPSLFVNLFCLFATHVICSSTRGAPATEIPNFQLVNQNGKPFQLYDLKGQFTFLSFIYTRCPLPNMCPLTVTLNKRLVKKWKEGKDPLPLRVLLVTLDPSVDNPAVLRRFARTRGLDPRRFTLATGNPQVLSDFASRFNVLGIPSDGMISHNVKSILLSPTMSELKQYRDNGWSAEDVLKAMKDFSSNKL